MPEEKFSLIIKRNMFYSKYLFYSTYFIVKPITWSKQLLWQCTRAMAFFLTSLFLEWFWHEVRISDNSHKSVSKTYRLENGIFVNELMMVFFSPCSHSYTLNVLNEELPVSWQKLLKINWSVKVLWHNPSMGVACSRLWAIKPQWLTMNFSTDNTDWSNLVPRVIP